MLIDSHCHIYDEKFSEDRDQVIQRAEENGIERIFMPNCDSTTIEAMVSCEDKYPGICISTMGLHPCYVKENFKEELALVERWLSDRPFLAIGEIGLDFYWDKTFVKEQEIALRQQIEWALHYQVPIILHTRDSIDETISIVSEYIPKGLRGVFHCFSGNEEQAKIITEELNFFLGIGGVVTFKNSGVKDAIKKVSLDKIMLETDAPYLAPTPYRGKRNEPSYIKNIAEFLATELDIPFKELAERTSKNCDTFFDL
jgi:TatD DNase family protein